MHAQRVGKIVLIINLLVSLLAVPGQATSRMLAGNHLSGNASGGAIKDYRTLAQTNTAVSTVVGSGSIAAGSFAAVRVLCPAGTVAVGGGLDLENVLTMVVTSSGPTFAQNNERLIFQPNGTNPAPVGWQASARNNDTTTKLFKVAVVCAPLSGVSTVVGSGSIAVGNFDAVRVLCPAGTVAVGGGLDLENVLTMVATSSGPTFAQNNERLIFQPDGANPAPVGWQASARNNDTATQPFKIAVICASLSGVSTVVGSGNVAVGSFDAVRVLCPAGTVALDGGLDPENVLTMVMTSSGPTFAQNNNILFFQPDGANPAPIGWQASARNNDTATRPYKIAVICGQPSSNPVPTITKLVPANVTAGSAGFTLTVDGTDFATGATVRWNGADRSTTFVNSTQLKASISAADIAVEGTAEVTVFNPAPGGGLSNALTFTIKTPPSNPVPAITKLVPASVTAGNAGLTLTVNGTGFVTGATVRWNGADRSTTFVNSTQLKAGIAAADIAVEGTAEVTVFNPAPGGGLSNALTFAINKRISNSNPIPAITGLAPATATAGSAGFTLTVDGTDFATGATVRWNGADRPTTFVNSTQVNASIAAADIAVEGTAEVTVFNPAPGGGLSNALTFAISKPTSAYAISGHIRTSSGAPIAGLLVSAGAGQTVITSGDGSYAFSGLPAGTYTITPISSLYRIAPKSRAVSVPPSAADQDFSAIPSPVYLGLVRTAPPMPPPPACKDDIEPNDRPDQARQLRAHGRPCTGSFQDDAQGQDDYYKVGLAAGQTISVDLTNIPAGADYDLVLYNVALTQLAVSKHPDQDDEHILPIKVGKAGIYYIRVYMRTKSTIALNTYVFQVTIS